MVPVDAPENQNDSACKCIDEAIVVVDADVQFDLYDIILIIYPRPQDEQGAFVNNCGFQGFNGYETITTDDGTFQKGMIWINGFATLHIIAYEMGHLFGFTHPIN